MNTSEKPTEHTYLSQQERLRIAQRIEQHVIRWYTEDVELPHPFNIYRRFEREDKKYTPERFAKKAKTISLNIAEKLTNDGYAHLESLRDGMVYQFVICALFEENSTSPLTSVFIQSICNRYAVHHTENAVERCEASKVPPTLEELWMGVYVDELEEQVRDTVTLLRKKGYNTIQSGYYTQHPEFHSGGDMQMLHLSCSALSVPPNVIATLARRGIRVEVKQPDSSIGQKSVSKEGDWYVLFHPPQGIVLPPSEWKTILDTFAVGMPDQHTFVRPSPKGSTAGMIMHTLQKHREIFPSYIEKSSSEEERQLLESLLACTTYKQINRLIGIPEKKITLEQESAQRVFAFFEKEGLGVPIINHFKENGIPRYVHDLDYAGGIHARTGVIHLPKRNTLPSEVHEKITDHEHAHSMSRHRAHVRGDITLAGDDVNIVLKEGVHDHPFSGRLSERSGVSTQITRYSSDTHPSLVTSEDISIKKYSFFNGLNEAITDEVAYKIRSGVIDDPKIDHLFNRYRNERYVLFFACEAIAEKHGKKPREVFSLFLQSYVLGWGKELKYLLRDTFGPNALRVLAVMEARGYDSDGDPVEWTEKRNRRFLRRMQQLYLVYFNKACSQTTREKIAKRILKSSGIPYATS